MCGPKFCSMKITQNVRDYANNQKNAQQAAELDPEVEAGLNSMKTSFIESGRNLYHKV